MGRCTWTLRDREREREDRIESDQVDEDEILVLLGNKEKEGVEMKTPNEIGTTPPTRERR